METEGNCDMGVQTELTVETAQEREGQLQKCIKALEQQIYRQKKTIDSLKESMKLLREEVENPKISLDQFEGIKCFA